MLRRFFMARLRLKRQIEEFSPDSTRIDTAGLTVFALTIKAAYGVRDGRVEK